MIDDNKLIYNLENVVLKKPITADLFLTNFCNNKCKYCTYNRWNFNNKELKYITYNEFVRNIKILKDFGVKSVILTGGGEPMLNPDFDKITEYLDKIGMPYGINTNFNVYKKCNPTYLKVSLDAGTAEKYKEIRGVNTFDKVIENIKKFALNKNNKTKLGVQCVVTNNTEIEKFYEAVKNLNVDYIIFRPVESTRGDYYKIIKNNLEAKNICTHLFLIKKQDKRVHINYKWDERHTAFSKCHANCLQITLDENSNVIYCCHKPTEIIGHITDPDILEKKKNYKTDMSICDIPCRMTGPNKFLLKIENAPGDKDFI